MHAHPFFRIDFIGLNLPSRPRIVPVTAIPSSAIGVYVFNAAGFLPFFWSDVGLFNVLRPNLDFVHSILVFRVPLSMPKPRVILSRFLLPQSSFP